jgi:hypothetical protein
MSMSKTGKGFQTLFAFLRNRKMFNATVPHQPSLEAAMESYFPTMQLKMRPQVLRMRNRQSMWSHAHCKGDQFPVIVFCKSETQVRVSAPHSSADFRTSSYRLSQRVLNLVGGGRLRLIRSPCPVVAFPDLFQR